MRVIKLGLISAVFLFLLMTAISSLLPSTVNISRAIDINAPFDTVYHYINDVTEWKNWYAGFDTANVSFPGKTAGRGAIILVNRTTITVLDCSPDKIKTSWQTGKKSLEGEFNFFKQQGSQLITVQWHFSQHVKWYPWEKFASIVSDKVMSPAIEKSLNNLKKVVEK